MMTLEQALNRLEDMVSGCYQQQFPESELRTNTKEAVELIKFNFMTLNKIRNQDVRNSAFDTIIHTVLDGTTLPKSWQKKGMKTYLDLVKSNSRDHRIMQYPDVVDECIDCCNVILMRLNEEVLDEETEGNRALAELNRRYFHKYFYFRNNDIGSQFVWIKNITQDENSHFLVDGTVIFTNGVNNTIGLYDVNEFPIEDFYNFGDPENRFTTCEELEDALHSPMDTRLKSHVVNSREVAEDILFTFTWFYEIHIPDLAKILKTLKFD